jgi:hypothetical protein
MFRKFNWIVKPIAALQTDDATVVEPYAYFSTSEFVD